MPGFFFFLEVVDEVVEEDPSSPDDASDVDEPALLSPANIFFLRSHPNLAASRRIDVKLFVDIFFLPLGFDLFAFNTTEFLLRNISVVFFTALAFCDLCVVGAALDFLFFFDADDEDVLGALLEAALLALFSAFIRLFSQLINAATRLFSLRLAVGAHIILFFFRSTPKCAADFAPPPDGRFVAFMGRLAVAAVPILLLCIGNTKQVGVPS